MFAAIGLLLLVKICQISSLIGRHRQEGDRQSSLQQTRRTNQLCGGPSSLPSWLTGLVVRCTHSTGWSVVQCSVTSCQQGQSWCSGLLRLTSVQKSDYVATKPSGVQVSHWEIICRYYICIDNLLSVLLIFRDGWLAGAIPSDEIISLLATVSLRPGGRPGWSP